MRAHFVAPLLALSFLTVAPLRAEAVPPSGTATHASRTHSDNARTPPTRHKTYTGGPET